MLAVRQLEGRIGADSAASYVDLGQRASRHTHTHTVLSCTAGRPPVDRSLCHDDYTDVGHASHNPQTRALSFDTPQLLSPLCLHRGMPGSTPTCTPIHNRGGGSHVAPWAYDTAAADAAVCLFFLNFVTFSTKHGSTSDKACSRPLGSRYVHANAHRRP